MWFLIAFCSFIAVGDAGFADTLEKCGMSDNNCHKNLIQTVLKDIGKTGVEELGIPPIDPLQLSNVSVPILGVLDLSLEDGVLKGVKDCNVNNIVSDIPNGNYSIELTCDYTIKARYKPYSSSPMIKSLLRGDFVRGDGVAEVKVDKITTRINFVPFVFKNKAGEVFVTSNINETTCDFDIAGNLQFSANVYLGDVDVSKVVTEILNQNAIKALSPYFRKPFIDKGLEMLYSLGNRFFEFVPAKYYIKEDLSPFVNIIKESSL